MEDDRILDLFFFRDETAIQETALKYGNQLTGISQNITGNDSDAEECVNDTYLAAWNRIPPERPRYFGAYLFRIVRNISYHCLRRNTARKRNITAVSLDEELSEIIPDPCSQNSNEGELGAAIDRFLLKSDRETQYLFVRRYFYADSISSLSSLTGISQNGITLRLFRIRKKLKDFLEKEGFPL